MSPRAIQPGSGSDMPLPLAHSLGTSSESKASGCQCHKPFRSEKVCGDFCHTFVSLVGLPGGAARPDHRLSRGRRGNKPPLLELRFGPCHLCFNHISAKEHCQSVCGDQTKYSCVLPLCFKLRHVLECAQWPYVSCIATTQGCILWGVYCVAYTLSLRHQKYGVDLAHIDIGTRVGSASIKAALMRRPHRQW